MGNGILSCAHLLFFHQVIYSFALYRWSKFSDLMKSFGVDLRFPAEVTCALCVVFFLCLFFLTGVVPIDATPSRPYAECYRVVLDGAVVGWVEWDLAPQVAEALRRFKVVLFKM